MKKTVIALIVLAVAAVAALIWWSRGGFASR